MNTSVANSMINAGDKTTLDRHVKNLFGHKAVLVPLLQYCVTEFKGIVCDYSEAIEQIGIEAGIKKGRAEGRAEGKAEGEAKLGRLMQKLLSLKRYDDAEKASVDATFRAKLYNEFQMA